MTDNNRTKEKLPDYTTSYWTKSITLPEFPKLEKDIHVDAVIVGGGITGITTAYLLANKGLKVALLEADKLLNGTSGHTTAKITAQHHLIYDELITNMGKSKARLYYEANMTAMNFIIKTIDQLQIECDFSKQDAWLYATTEDYAIKLEQEAKAYEALGIKSSFVDEIPLDIKVKNALIMKNQAQFHPLKYLTTLVNQIIKEGDKFLNRQLRLMLKQEINQPYLLVGIFMSQLTISLLVHIFPFTKDLVSIQQE